MRGVKDVRAGGAVPGVQQADAARGGVLGGQGVQRRGYAAGAQRGAVARRQRQRVQRRVAGDGCDVDGVGVGRGDGVGFVWGRREAGEKGWGEGLWRSGFGGVGFVGDIVIDFSLFVFFFGCMADLVFDKLRRVRLDDVMKDAGNEGGGCGFGILDRENGVNVEFEARNEGKEGRC